MSACRLSRSAVDLEGTWELVEGWMQARLGGSVVTGGGGSLVAGGGGGSLVAGGGSLISSNVHVVAVFGG